MVMQSPSPPSPRVLAPADASTSSSPFASSPRASHHTLSFSGSPRSRTQSRTPRTMDVKTAMSPGLTAAEILARNEGVMRNIEQLRIERSDMFASLRRAESLLDPAGRLKDEKKMKTLRLDGLRTARPTWGTYEYAAPVARGCDLSRGAEAAS